MRKNLMAFVLAFLFAPFLLADCVETLTSEDAFSRQWLTQLSRTTDPHEFKAKIVKITTAYSSAVAMTYFEENRRKWDELSRIIDNRECGTVACLIANEKRTQLAAKILFKATQASFKAEQQVRGFLLKLSDDQPQLQDRLEKYYGEKFFSLNKLYTYFKSMRTAVFFQKLRSSTEEGELARQHWLKSMGNVLGFQAIGYATEVIPKYLADSAFSFLADSQWYVFPNTAFMMTLQAEVGAANTPPVQNINVQELAQFEGFVRNLPALLHGDDGYHREAKATLGGFFSLLPADLLAMSAFRSLKEVVSGHDVTFTHMLAASGEASVSMSIFLTYLMSRWAYVDTKLSLRIFPNLLKGMGMERDAIWTSVKSKYGLPSDLKIIDYIKFMKRSSDTSSDAERNVWQSDEFREIIQWQSKIKWVDWANTGWRWSFQSLDAFIMFNLLGSWVPALLPQVYSGLEQLFR